MSVMNQQREIWERLAAARYDMEAPRDFERWACASVELEQVVGPEWFLAFISRDYGQPHAAVELAKEIDRCYAELRPGALPRDIAAWTARALLNGEIGLADACRMLTELWREGEEWVPTEFVYIDSELDEIPVSVQKERSDAGALSARSSEDRTRFAEFGRAAREVAGTLLQTLEAEQSAP